MIIESMAMAGAEPTFCMGDDTPLPVLSSKPHQLSDYFKQRFAQVPMRVCWLFNRVPQLRMLFFEAPSTLFVTPCYVCQFVHGRMLLTTSYLFVCR